MTNALIKFYSNQLFGSNQDGEVSRKIKFNNTIDVKLTLKKKGKKYIFSASGGIWNISRDDYEQCGQCLDTIKNKYLHILDNPTLFTEMYILWNKWHLNDMNAGSPEQTKLVEEFLKNNPYNYSAICEFLKTKGMLEHNGYKYGSSWLFRDIDTKDLEKIMQILTTNNCTIGE